jgi:hypothetical protein
MSEAVKAVRTCQNLSELDGTCLGLLLLHVGPNCENRDCVRPARAAFLFMMTGPSC